MPGRCSSSATCTTTAGAWHRTTTRRENTMSRPPRGATPLPCAVWAACTLSAGAWRGTARRPGSITSRPPRRATPAPCMIWDACTQGAKAARRTRPGRSGCTGRPPHGETGRPCSSCSGSRKRRMPGPEQSRNPVLPRRRRLSGLQRGPEMAGTGRRAGRRARHVRSWLPV